MSVGCSQGCSLRASEDVSDSYLGVRGVPRGVVSELVEMYLTLTWELGVFLEV